MSKISQKNKELKGKQAKIAKSKATKQETNTLEEVKQSTNPNYNKCCTCKMHSNNPSYCRMHKAYCGRKQDGCADYKVK